jgi:hypothetical protein
MAFFAEGEIERLSEWGRELRAFEIMRLSRVPSIEKAAEKGPYNRGVRNAEVALWQTGRNLTQAGGEGHEAAAYRAGVLTGRFGM